MDNIVLASLISSIFLNIHFLMLYREEKRSKEFYQQWNEEFIKVMTKPIKPINNVKELFKDDK